jgi:hypothetical protein
MIFQIIHFSEHSDAQRRYQEDIDMATRLIEEADLHGQYDYANLLMEFRESVVRLQIIEWGKRNDESKRATQIHNRTTDEGSQPTVLELVGDLLQSGKLSR